MPGLSAEVVGMKNNSNEALNEARDLDLFVQLVRGLRGWILRIERTEEEIARGSKAELEGLMVANSLRLA